MVMTKQRSQLFTSVCKASKFTDNIITTIHNAMLTSPDMCLNLNLQNAWVLNSVITLSSKAPYLLLTFFFQEWNNNMIHRLLKGVTEHVICIAGEWSL